MALVTSVEATYAEATAEAALAVWGESHTADPAAQVTGFGAVVEVVVELTTVIVTPAPLASVTITVALVLPLASWFIVSFGMNEFFSYLETVRTVTGDLPA